MFQSKKIRKFIGNLRALEIHLNSRLEPLATMIPKLCIK